MEELKMIAETISKLGEGAQTAFIVWVLSRYVLLYLLTTFGIVTVVILIYRFIKRVSSLEQIKEAAGILDDDLSSYDLEKIIKMVKRGKEK